MSQALKNIFNGSSGSRSSFSNQSSMEVTPDITPLASIKVVGVGGAGTNAVERMAALNLQGVELIAMNTDEQVLKKSNLKDLRNFHIF